MSTQAHATSRTLPFFLLLMGLAAATGGILGADSEGFGRAEYLRLPDAYEAGGQSAHPPQARRPTIRV